MAPKEKQKIEIEKTHRDPLLSFNQAVTVNCSDFLGTALKEDQKTQLTLRRQGCLGFVHEVETGASESILQQGQK